jgi:polysaccharide chain length determinant protein (PEP-CTERM system associated)
MPEEVRGASVLELVQGMWSRRKWLAIVAFAVPFAAALSLVTFLPNIYRSTVTVMVDRQQVPEAFVRPTVTSALETRLQTVRQELLSRSRLEGLIDRFGLYPDLRTRAPMEVLVDRMRRDIELKPADQKDQPGISTLAFGLSYRGRDPEKVAQVANDLAGQYIEENLKARARQAAGTADFLKAQLTGVKARLDEQERVLSDFKRRYLGELPQQLDTNLATVERLNAQIQANADSQARAVERRDALLRQLADAGTVSGASPDTTEDRVAKLKEELRQLRVNYSDKYPDVVRLKAEIAALEREISQKGSEPQKETRAVATVQSPYAIRTKQTLSEVESDINILKNEEKRLRSAVAAYLGRVENVPRREQEFKELSRDYDTTRELYATLMRRYEEAQLAESMEHRQKGEQFKVLEAATPALDPAAPNRPRLILVSLALSLGLAMAAVVGVEQLNAAFHSVDELRGFTSIPVMVSIPRIVTPADVVRRKRRTRLVAVASMASLVLIVGVCYLIAHENEFLVSLLTPGRS